MKKVFKGFFFIMLLNFISGCGWVLVGGGAYEGYKVATDPRTVGIQIDDAMITAKVKARLIDDPITKARKIDVDTVNGVVTLTGAVDSPQEIERAVEIAQSVPGVKKIVNNLRVEKRSIGSYISDKEITTKIKLKFISDPEIKAFSLDVDTVNGIVTLTGVVEKESQKNKAIELAKSVEGVKWIIVNISVKEKQ